MKSGRVAAFLLCLILITFSGAASDRENFTVSADWSSFQIMIRAHLPIEEDMPVNLRHQIRDYAKEEILRESSLYLENFLLDSENRIRDVLGHNRAFARNYSLFLEDLEIGSIFFRKDHIETSLQIPLRGKRGLIASSPVQWNTEQYRILEAEEYAGEAYETRTVKGEYSSSLAPVLYSGLIIDAREIKSRTALFPRIYSQNGRLIYGPEFLSEKTGKERGVLAYLENLKDPEVSKRAGKNPLLTMALAARGRYQTDLVISNEDAARLFDHPASVENLRKCRVIVLMGRDQTLKSEL